MTPEGSADFIYSLLAMYIYIYIYISQDRKRGQFCVNFYEKGPHAMACVDEEVQAHRGKGPEQAIIYIYI